MSSEKGLVMVTGSVAGVNAGWVLVRREGDVWGITYPLACCFPSRDHACKASLPTPRPPATFE